MTNEKKAQMLGKIKLVANLAWNACMSTPDLGKLFVPVPNLSLTD